MVGEHHFCNAKWLKKILFLFLFKVSQWFWVIEKEGQKMPLPLWTDDAFESYQLVGLSKWCQKRRILRYFVCVSIVISKKAKTNKTKILIISCHECKKLAVFMGRPIKTIQIWNYRWKPLQRQFPWNLWVKRYEYFCKVDRESCTPNGEPFYVDYIYWVPLQ